MGKNREIRSLALALCGVMTLSMGDLTMAFAETGEESKGVELQNGVVNGSFEEWGYDPLEAKGWTVESSKDQVMYDKWEGARDQSSYLQFWSEEAYDAELYQDVTGLQEGYYYLTAYLQNGGGQKNCYLYGDGSVESASMTMVPKSDDFRMVVVRGIHVGEDGKARIGLHTEANGGNYVSIDQVELVRETNQTEAYHLYKGGDFSQLTYQEDGGSIYYDQNGKAGDAIQILADQGMEIARLRLYNQPGKGNGHGDYYCKEGYEDEEDILELARRVAEKGMEIELSFHYSDYWSNGGIQDIPKAWREAIAGMTEEDAMDKLCQLIYDYTYDFMKKMEAQGTTPAYVSLGNEIQAGILFPYGKASKDNWHNLARLLNAGSKAVTDASADSKVIIHLDDAGNMSKYTEYFDYCEKYEVKYDIIGPSYYPFWTDKNVDKIVDFCNTMIERYDKDIMIMETAYNYNPTLPNGNPGQLSDNGDDYNDVYSSSPEGQKYFMAELYNGLKTIGLGTGHSCLGDLYWDPIMVEQKGIGWAMFESTDLPDINAISNTTMFDFDHKLLPVVEVLNWNREGKTQGRLSGKIVSNGDHENGIGNSLAEITLGEKTYSVRTDDFGGFVINDIAVGTYSPQIKVEGMEAIPGKELVLQDGITTYAEFAVTGSELSGSVKNQKNEPAGSAVIHAKINGTEYRTTTNGAGNYSLKDIPEGTCQVWASLEGYQDSEKQEVKLQSGEVMQNVNFTITCISGGLTGLVQEKTERGNRTIADARVTAKTTAEAAAKSKTVHTDENGAYTITGLDADVEYTMTIEKEGYLTQNFIRKIALDQVIEANPVLLIADTGSVQGSVQDANGKAVTGAELTLTGKKKAYEVQSDSAGNYKFTDIPSGSYQIVAQKDGYMDSSEQEVEITYGNISKVEPIWLANSVKLVNAGFEEESGTEAKEGWNSLTAPKGWTLAGTVDETNGPAVIRQDRTAFQGTVEGTFALSFWMDRAFTAEASQQVSNLRPGTYVMRAQTYSGMNGTFYMYAKDMDGKLIGSKAIEKGTGFITTDLVFEVEKENCTIGFYGDTAGGDWAVVDAVELGCMNEKEQTAPTDPEEPDTPVKSTKIRFKKSSLTLQIKEKYKNLSSKSVLNGPVKWSTSSSKIASVRSNGEVKAIATGKAKITARCGAKKASFMVYVAPKQVKNLKVRTIGRTAKVSWSKTTKADGYQIWMRIGKTGKYKLTGTVKKEKSSYQKTKLKKGQTYYYKVRAYTVMDKKKVYGNYSGAVKCKIK